jgi:hypothetical protein
LGPANRVIQLQLITLRPQDTAASIGGLPFGQEEAE